MNTTRRGFILGAGATLLAAPAIVRAASLMPVRNRLEMLTVRDLRIVIDALEQNGVVPLPDGSYVAYLSPRGLSAYIPPQILPLRWQGVRFIAREPILT